MTIFKVILLEAMKRKRREGEVDHLVNNAGITSLCSINEVTDIAMLTPLMDINFWGSVYPTYFAIPHLKKTRGKVFVNSSSVALCNHPLLVSMLMGLFFRL
ncbi:11-beta-hydroxysteroid dehydrogenase-like 2 [Solanum lycopersicum]|uniref:11-beta-hydroxysteroid dehydrogenase-like 2 n=1 Tax=Solanum lycopersicum TaxID=4081 RepID=UPI003747A4DB